MTSSGYVQHELHEDDTIVFISDDLVEGFDWQRKMNAENIKMWCRQFGVGFEEVHANKIRLKSIRTTVDYFPRSNKYCFISRCKESEVWDWKQKGEIKRAIDFVLAIK